MSKPSKRVLREARGRSILDNAEETADQLKAAHRVFHKQLSHRVMEDLRALYIYMQDTAEAENMCQSFDLMVCNFRSKPFPEGEVFFWQQQVLSVIHALNLWIYKAKNDFNFSLTRPKPPHAGQLRDHSIITTYFSFPKEQREHIHDTILEITLSPEDVCMNCESHFFIVDAMNEVKQASIAEALKLRKQGAHCFGEAFGAMCSACNSVGNGKMACARCQNVFYCGRECQKAHWPQHKKQCAKKKAAATSAKAM